MNALPLSNDWTDLTELEGTERVAEFARRLDVLAGAGEPTRQQALRELVTYVYDLPDEGVQDMTAARVRALLTLDQTAAHRVARSYDAVLDTMPAAIAMRRVALVQQVARDLSVEDRERLHELEPGIVGAEPAAFLRDGVAGESVQRGS